MLSTFWRCCRCAGWRVRRIWKTSSVDAEVFGGLIVGVHPHHPSVIVEYFCLHQHVSTYKIAYDFKFPYLRTYIDRDDIIHLHAILYVGFKCQNITSVYVPSIFYQISRLVLTFCSASVMLVAPSIRILHVVPVAILLVCRCPCCGCEKRQVTNAPHRRDTVDSKDLIAGRGVRDDTC